MMTTHFPLNLLRFAPWAVCLAFILSVSSLSASEYLGPVFPNDTIVNVEDMVYAEPLPLPRPNSLLQRPRNRQVVYDDPGPDDSIIPQGLLYDDDFDAQAEHIIRQKVPTRVSKVIDTDTFSDNSFFVDGEIIHEGIVGDAFEVEPSFGLGLRGPGRLYSGLGGMSGPIPLTFGMGTLDNLSLFAEVTTFKTHLSEGAGTFGFSEGFNWSLPVTPQGTFTGQFGVRAVQGEMFAPASRDQVFLTGGFFKRFDRLPAQGGAVVDWLEDRSGLGKVTMRQMRVELSGRIRHSFEYGFMGGFDVFGDRPSTDEIDYIAQHYISPWAPYCEGAVVAQDYYLLFARKHLSSGGQVELRGGTTARSDFIFGAGGEAALSDQLSVNGGISMLIPTDGRSERGYYRESWTISFGVILRLRGGAVHRQSNMYRPMFDVAGNNSFFPKIIPVY